MQSQHKYHEITHDIEITVEPRFEPEHSRPGNSEFLFIYKITIKNLGNATAQLKSRHWIITDGTGRTEEVRGPGVVGEKPHLKPNQTYTYESFCPISTPTGNMRGTYTMISDSGEEFLVTIPLFFLRSDYVH